MENSIQSKKTQSSSIETKYTLEERDVHIAEINRLQALCDDQQEQKLSDNNIWQKNRETIDYLLKESAKTLRDLETSYKDYNKLELELKGLQNSLLKSEDNRQSVLYQEIQ
jgi:hypothetical protein